MELSLKHIEEERVSPGKCGPRTSKEEPTCLLGPTNRGRGELWVLPKRLTALTHSRGGGGGQEEYIRKLGLSYVVSRIKFSAVPRVMPLASFQH